MSVSLTGNDTIQIATRVFSDFADQDVALLEFPNNVVEVKHGKNGNALYAFNATGKLVNVTLRLIRASADDKFLNSQLQSFLNDQAGYTLMEGEFVKRVGDGKGNVTADVYRMSGGIVQKLPNTRDNVEGDTEQSVSIWNLVFHNGNRVMA